MFLEQKQEKQCVFLQHLHFKAFSIEITEIITNEFTVRIFNRFLERDEFFRYNSLSKMSIPIGKQI